MAEHYDPNNKGGLSSLSDWILPIVFLFFVPPVGILLIVLKLFGGNQSRSQRSRHPYYTQQQSTGARTTTGAAPHPSPAARGKKKNDPFKAMSRKSRRLTFLGGAMALFFGFVSVFSFLDALSWLGLFSALWDCLPLFCLTAGGAGAWWAGWRQKKKLRRFRQYMAMIGKRDTISISALASATALSPGKVREDLLDLLDLGLFPSGYLDFGGDVLVLSADGLREQPKPEPRSVPSEEAENAVLAEIRAVNDAIAHQALSAQIDRIGVITAKIFDYQKAHPEKSPQLHSFLSYYLPTTLKILRAYAQLESQGIEGENISAAKTRIEGMMNKVVEGFEKQLDQLFQGDALDIASDVQVLEQMLSKDGLSSSPGLRLGM